jgi:hypothetical protein
MTSMFPTPSTVTLCVPLHRVVLLPGTASGTWENMGLNWCPHTGGPHQLEMKDLKCGDNARYVNHPYTQVHCYCGFLTVWSNTKHCSSKETLQEDQDTLLLLCDADILSCGTLPSCHILVDTAPKTLLINLTPNLLKFVKVLGHQANLEQAIQSWERPFSGS